MTFLNLALLAGALALAVPVIIHLLSRRRFRPIAWGAMFLIEQVVRQNRRRIQIEQWILLAIRCAVPVALALAMARPVMTGWRALVGDEPASAVVILDASYSMSAAASAGGSASEAAKRAMQTVLSQLPEGSDAKVLIAGSGTRPLEVASGRRVPRAEELQVPEPQFGPLDAPGALAAARSMLEQSSHRRREIVLISDFQKLNWSAPAAATPATPEPERQAGDALAPELTFIRINAAGDANVHVEDVTLSPSIAGAGRPVRVRAQLRNSGRHALMNLPVRLLVDGVPRGESRLNLAAGATSEANFVTRFDSPGAHVLEVVVEGDSLPADNAFRLAADVPEALPVLLVAGETDLPFPQNPADFLQVALDPAAASPGVALSSLLRPSVVAADELNARALGEARVVVLAGVPRLTDSQASLLRDFVRDGGGLVVFPDARSDIAFYNASDLLPARLSNLRGSTSAGGGPETRVAEPPYAHPALLPWNDPGNGRLGEATIRRWYALEPKAATASAVAMLESGEPFLIEQALGRGVVLMAAAPADSSWSDLPLRASFLPLVQQLVTYAAGRSAPPRTVWAGEPLVLAVAPERAQQHLTMLAPDGSRRLVSTTLDRGRTLARYADTAVPGLYHLLASTAGQEDETLALFAVNAPRSESDLTPLESAELAALAQTMGASVAEGGEGYATLDRDRRYGQEVWRWVWVGLLALLFGELLLQGWFATRGMKAPPGSPGAGPAAPARRWRRGGAA